MSNDEAVARCLLGEYKKDIEKPLLAKIAELEAALYRVNTKA